MKCLKVDEYIKRTASVKETKLLRLELQSYVEGQSGLQGRTLCDRVIRACNHQLGANNSDSAHISELVKLVKVAVNGYDSSGKNAAQSSPFYMEKIIFHILKKLSSLEVNSLCSEVAELLHARLIQAEQCEDYTVLVRSSFSVLWNQLSSTKDNKTVHTPGDKLHCQLQALSFLLLLDSESDKSSASKAPIYAQDAVWQFENSLGVVAKEDSNFLFEEMLKFFSKLWISQTVLEGNTDHQHTKKSSLHSIFQIALMITKVFCKAGHYDIATTLLDKIESKVRELVDCQYTALVQGKMAVKIHAALKASQDFGHFLIECARALRSLSTIFGDNEANAVLEGCGLVVWAVESSHTKALSGPLLLAWFSFLEEHQEYISKVLKKNSVCPAENHRLQQVLCLSIYQGFVFAYESMQASQLEDSAVLDRVLLFCQATAGQMMTELHKLNNENLCIKAVVAVSNLACGLYNRRLYEQAFILLEILCKDLSKKHLSSLSADRLNRPFMLAVQTSRRAGQLERALDWVILWLKVLGDKIIDYISEPVSLWVKTKMDAARNADEDIRLRTLRDGFGPDVPEEGVLLCLLDEELRAYKEIPGDTAQERYNTLCDLLDICHEESPHTHLRAVYLCEMAQVVCFQDFSEQTDCTAVDFTHEALRLLEAEPRTPKDSDKLTDDKAHALLWLYICTLEKNLQEAIARDKKRQELRDQTQSVTNPVWTNDFEYEDKQKSQDSITVYEGLHFSLDAQNKLCQPLERALSAWSALLKRGALPSVRNPKQTCNSIAIMAALFRLMGKPLKAVEAYQLAIGLAQKLGEAHCCATYLCQSASLLLEMGTPQIALVQIEQAEKFLSSETTAEGPSSLSVLATLLKAQYCYSMGQVNRGVPYLCEVLKEANEQKLSKSWYLLRARTLQTVCSYLCLDTNSLTQAQRNLIHQHGINSPDTAIYESLKLFCSLLVTLVGKGLYGNNGGSQDVRFVDQGENLSLKWQLLSDLLACSMKMVSVRSSSGAVNDARLQCLEALKLAIKLQALSQCAELLVVKAELELLQGEKEESGCDLDKVRNLLELCTDISDQKQKSDMKIKPRKGRPAQRPDSPLPVEEDDLKDILSTRWIAKEPVLTDLTSSPPLKALPRRWLSSLSHKSDCQCCICSEPCLGRVTVRWAATRADLDLQLDPDQAKVGLKLHWAALARSKNISAKLGVKLAKIFAERPTKPHFLHDIVAQMYLRIALCGLDSRMGKVCNPWKVLEAGLAFVESTPNPVIQPIKAGLMSTKAILSLITIASNNGCPPEELFAHIWEWKPPKQMDEMKIKNKMVPSTPVTKKEAKITKDGAKNGHIDKQKELKKPKIVKPKVEVTGSSSRAKVLVPMTPVMPKSKSSSGELGVFDFNTAVPTLACTPVHKVKPPASAQKAPKTVSKLQFQVYEEMSPEQEKPQPVPAAPRRTRRLRFKADFSDESDSEANTKTAPKKEVEVPKTRSAGRKPVHSSKAGPDPPAAPDKTPVAKRLGRKKGTTALSQTVSSDEEEQTRRGRSKRATRGTKAESEVLEEPDKMRTIDEETTDVLDMSIEELRASDTDNDEVSSQGMDFEVLRRDMILNKDDLFELKSRDNLREGSPTGLPHTDFRPNNVSLDDVKSLLSSAWMTLQHLPSPNIYSQVCALLALTIGQEDPQTTAMLHAQSLGITSRHRTIRHLASSLKKLRKASNDLKDKMEALTLDDMRPNVAAHRLCQLENVFSFATTDTGDFPKSHSQEFMQQIQHIPPGVSVCVVSVLGVKPGQMGDSLLLSRLERDSAPITVHISTSRQQHPVSWMVQEIDNIQVEQKVVSSVADKAKWWEGRRALDSRVEELLNEMETMLSCWKSLVLPFSSDPELCRQAQNLHKALAAKGVTVSFEMLKAVLSAAPVLSEDDLKMFAFGVCPQWDLDCDQLLQTAVSELADREEPKGHVVLILDKYLQKLPWESISVWKSRSVSRMPSLHSLIGLSIDKEITPKSILKQGVDTKKVFYVLDPDGNLENSKERFKEWFSSKTDWEGVCGVAPDSGKLMEAVASKDLYVYVGHGAGARFLDSQAVLKQQMRAASLLFGCSSAALAVRGQQEGQGIILYYLIAGCPFVLGNLWDVTDRDIDRFTKALLESWMSAGRGAPLLDYMGPARQATHLKYLIGAAPVVYGLPIHLL